MRKQLLYNRACLVIILKMYYQLQIKKECHNALIAMYEQSLFDGNNVNTKEMWSYIKQLLWYCSFTTQWHYPLPILTIKIKPT